ncbi:MAG: DUF559 domain-containing protein [Ignisphaera sp.]
MGTEEVTYPCPKCGIYNKPFMYTSEGIALMLCSNCNVQYKTSTKVSANFRKFCSKVARKKNRSQSYYTSLEKKAKKILEDNGYIQGRDYFHNILFENGRSKYYVDFFIPKENLIIEINGSVWHNLWNRQSSDNKKIKYLESLGYNVIVLSEKTIKELPMYLQHRVI